MNETNPKRRWFRFSLRMLFVLVTIAGVCSWVVRQMTWIRQRHEHLNTIDAEWKQDTTAYPYVSFQWETAKPPVVLRVFGEQGCPTIVMPRKSDRGLIEKTHGLFPEAELVVFSDEITDEEIANMQHFGKR